jgi:putative phosphoribosyl transferase
MNPGLAYRNRYDAGEFLAAHVLNRIGAAGDAVVLALPRGGVPVGFEVARRLDAILDVIVVRKLGMPGHEEFAVGAIAAGGFEVLDESIIAELGIAKLQIAAVADREATELLRREKVYRENRPAVRVHRRTVILVDDGLATGLTMRAAITAMRAQRPSGLVVAVPVGAPETCEKIAREVDILICPLQPEDFRAVSMWYRDFAATADGEVRECLRAARATYEAAHHVYQ